MSSDKKRKSSVARRDVAADPEAFGGSVTSCNVLIDSYS